MPAPRRWLPVLGILLLAFAALVVIWPSRPGLYLPSAIPWPEGQGVSIPGIGERREMRLGLDLRGGTRLLLGATLPPGEEGDIEDAIEGTITVLRRRVNASGLAEAEITRQGRSNISVQLPGLTPEQARSLLGRTAQLRFCQRAEVAQTVRGERCDVAGEWVQAYGTIDGAPVALTGRFLAGNSFVDSDALGNPLVAFQWRDDGPELSEQITSRLLNLELGIFLDDERLSSPSRECGDPGARQSSPALRSSARASWWCSSTPARCRWRFPCSRSRPWTRRWARTRCAAPCWPARSGSCWWCCSWSCTTGCRARWPRAALVIYALLTVAVYKLIPVTLTLAGIGAFVLSVGMAVDANILIFERMKEELRAGRAYATAVEVGFRRAWPSIRDSNVTTLITAAILYVLGEGAVELPLMGSFDSPQVQGFAAVLFIGVVVSMFSAIVVTRSLLGLLIGTPVARRHDWMTPGARPAPGSATAGGDA